MKYIGKYISAERLLPRKCTYVYFCSINYDDSFLIQLFNQFYKQS
jgi:hypothetical protein